MYCQCLKIDGLPCTRLASKNPIYDNRYCWQHQNCKNSVMIELTKDMKIKIFSQLSLIDLFHVCLTTKSFNNICQREDFWFFKLQKDYSYIKTQNTSYKRTYQEIKHLEHSLQIGLEKKHPLLVLTPNALKCLILILSYLGQRESMDSMLVGQVYIVGMREKSKALATLLDEDMTYWLMFNRNDIEILTSKPILNQQDFLKKESILAYVASEILELAGNVSRDWGKSKVDINQIRIAIANDEELRSMFKDVDCLNKFILDKNDSYKQYLSDENSSLSDDDEISNDD